MGATHLLAAVAAVTTSASRHALVTRVIVGGDAYGSGSSREVAVVAHQGAGIQLVVARSFQRIFQENMVDALRMQEDVDR